VVRERAIAFNIRTPPPPGGGPMEFFRSEFKSEDLLRGKVKNKSFGVKL